MASRGGAGRAQPESQLAERRLRPVYDLLDCGSNKKALQEADKVLKKWPRSQCARALKSLATLRLGREREALEQLEALVAEVPTDDAALLVMTVVYRETRRLDRVCRMYEAAVKKDPANEELHTQLFMSHVRVADFENQHRSAAQLYRLKPKNPYYFWAVMSVVLQATEGAGRRDPVKRDVLLALARRMVDKFIDENKLEAEEEVDLYLMILELRGEREEALAFLESPLGRRLSPGALPRASLPVLVDLRRWGRLNAACRGLIEAEPDRWDYYLLYFRSAFELALAPEGEGFDDSPDRCLAFVSSIAETAGLKARGPRLARLELYKRTRDSGRDLRELPGDVADLLVDYFETFGHKACSVSDLRPYLSLVDRDRREDLAQRFSDAVGISAICLPESDEQMQRHVCSLQLGRMCGRQAVLAEEHARCLAATLALHCERAALRPPRSPTERAPYDPYSLLAAHLCYDLALKCADSKPLVEALCLLEYVLQNSPSNFHCKLLCVKFYHMLGCGAGAHSAYELLNVKHVQLDSLGYVHVAHLGATGLYGPALAAYESANKFFTHSYKDSVDHLTFSYKFGSFVKLRELMKWHERLHGSLHRALVLTEKIMLSVVMATLHSAAVRLLSQAGLDSPENVIVWDALRDNRDLGVFASWDPIDVENPNAAAEQFERDRNYVRLKFRLLRCLTACASVSGAGPRADAESNSPEITSLKSAMEEFDDAFRRLESERPEIDGPVGVASPLPSRLLGFINSPMPYRETYANAFSMVLMYAKSDFENARVTANRLGVNVDECLRCACDILARQMEKEDQLWTCRATFEVLVNFVEMLAAVSTVIGTCGDIAKQTNSKKGTKKKGAGVSTLSECAPVEPVSAVVERLSVSANALFEMLESWTCPRAPKDLSDHFSDLSVVIGDTGAVTEKLRDGHAKSVGSIKNTLKEKLKYLSTIAV